MVITGINNITSVGHDAQMTAASVRAGLGRFVESDEYYDLEGNPITVSMIRGLDDDNYDRVERLGNIADYCLGNMLEAYFADDTKEKDAKREMHLFLGCSNESRPGPRYEGDNNEIANRLTGTVKKYADNVKLDVVKRGNSSVIDCIAVAGKLIKENPGVLCIVGGIDSLLAMETLDWFEDFERLKSKTFGRNHSFAPGEAVGFMIIESEEAARKEKIVARIAGIGVADEPAHLVSEAHCKGEGLTKACRGALAGNSTENISDTFCDLNGEFFRTKEWSYARLRCFEKTEKKRTLWHPAEFTGDIGAASGAVLIGIACAGLWRGWLAEDVLLFCSDDHGGRGALVLKRVS